MKKQIEFLKSLIVSYKADLTILDELLLQRDIQSCEVLIKKRKAQIEIVESEALTLHAMMMTSMPYFILMKPNTLEIINRIWEFRLKTGSNICFTLDAGANVHVLYPESECEQVLEFIKNELVAFCQNGHYICDRIGFGAKQL